MKGYLKIIKKHPILLGIAGSICLIGMIVCYQLSASRKIVNATVETQELQREATLDKLSHPESLVEYLLTSVETRDLDMALRSFAIDETILNILLEKIINAEDQFYTNMEIAPSGSYSIYNEISASELAGKYAESFQTVLDFFEENEGLQVKNIDYVKPEEQLTSENISRNAKIIEARGGDSICEMMVRLEDGENEYILGVTLDHYENYWKVLHLGAVLSETTEEEPIRLIDIEEYDILKGKIGKNNFQQKLQELSVDLELFEKETEQNSYEELLPANYVVVNALKEKNPQKVIEKFVLSIEKEELVRAMAYCMDAKDEELEHTTVDLLKKQADCAKEIKRFCYGFLGCDYQEDESALEQIGKSGSSIQNELNPEYFMYFDLINSFLLKDNEDEREYLLCYLYDGEYYISGMTLEDHDGWYIQSLSISNDEMELNRLEKISKTEYETIEKKYSTDR